MAGGPLDLLYIYIFLKKTIQYNLYGPIRCSETWLKNTVPADLLREKSTAWLVW